MKATDPNCYLGASHAALLTRPAATRFVLSHGWVLYLLTFGVAYLVLFCNAIPTFIDEAYTYNLATDKTLTHMLSALRDGADGSFPLYALLVYGWQKLFGPSELSLRLNSAVFVLLFVWHLSRRLAREFGLGAAALAIVFVLADKIFAYYALQARFYGLLMFLLSLCFWSTWDLLQSRTISRRQQTAHALFCGLLCLSHPLGLVYTGILGLLYFTFSVVLKRFSFGNGLAFLGGPGLFLVWLPSFLRQRLVNPTYAAGPRGWLKYWQFGFFDSKVLFLTLIAGLILVVAACWVFKSKRAEGISGTGVRPVACSGSTSLIAYAVAFIFCLNGTLALLDATHFIPVYWMAAIRYLLVCWVAYAVVIASSFALAARLARKTFDHYGFHVSDRLQFLLVLMPLLLLMGSHWGRWFRARASDAAYLAKISMIANQKRCDVVCASHWDAFYLATRTQTAQVKYLLANGDPFRSLMLQIAKHYPCPAAIDSAALRQFTNEYLFLSDFPRKAHIVNPAPQ